MVVTRKVAADVEGKANTQASILPRPQEEKMTMPRFLRCSNSPPVQVMMMGIIRAQDISMGAISCKLTL